MIFLNDLKVKRDMILEANKIPWKSFISKGTLIAKHYIVPVVLEKKRTKINILVQYVVENRNNFQIEGKFYDCNHEEEEDGEMYSLRISFFNDEDKASIEFIPRPRSAILEREWAYIEEQKKSTTSII